MPYTRWRLSARWAATAVINGLTDGDAHGRRARRGGGREHGRGSSCVPGAGGAWPPIRLLRFAGRRPFRWVTSHSLRLPKALVNIAARDAEDPWTHLAVLCSARHRAAELIERLAVSEFAGPPRQALLDALATQIGAAHKPAEVQGLLSLAGSLAATNKSLAQRLVKQFMLALPPQAAGIKLEARMRKTLERRAGRGPARGRRSEANARGTCAAVQTLVLLPLADVQPLLTRLLAADQPQPVQAAVLKHIARYHQPQVAEIVLAAWPGLGPSHAQRGLSCCCRGPLGPVIFWRRSVIGAWLGPRFNAGRSQLLASFPDAEVRRLAATALCGRLGPGPCGGRGQIPPGA